MKIRTDFVTNSSSSSYITIIATKKNGSIIKEELESEGFIDTQIFDVGIAEIVGATTVDGEEILRNIQDMYQNPRMDYLLDESDDSHPLRCIKNVKELLKIEIKEEVYGEVLACISCVNKDGDRVYPESASVRVTYDVENDSYSDMEYSAVSIAGEKLYIEK